MHTFIWVCFTIRRARIITSFSILLCAIVLTGCETMNKPSPAQANAIKSGQRSIVLFRTALSRTNEQTGGAYTNSSVFDYEIKKLNGQDMESKNLFDIPYASSTNAKSPGWKYFLLEPGDYFFQEYLLLGYTINITNPPVTFHVPTNTPLTYIGTFHHELEPLPKPGFWTSFFNASLPMFRLHNRGLKDESAQSAQVASESLLSEFGLPVTSLAMLYDDKPAAFSGFTNHLITKVETIDTTAFKTDDVGSYAATWAATPFVASGTSVIDDANGMPSNTSKERQHKVEQDAVGAALVLAAIPFAIVTDKTIGDAARKKWAPYQAALEKSFSGFGLDQQLTLAVSNQLSTLCPAETAATNLAAAQRCTLRIEPYRVLLREISGRKYSLEIAVLVKLVDASSQIVLWQHSYAYTDYQAPVRGAVDDNDMEYSFAPVESLIPTKTLPHKLEEYKNEAGIKSFQTELSIACDSLAKKLAGRLKQAGFVFKSQP